MEQYVLDLLIANPWLIWVILAFFILVVIVAVLIQQREFRSPWFGIGAKTASPPPTPTPPQVQPLQQTFNLGQLQLSEEQYENIYQRFKTRWEAEHPTLPVPTETSGPEEEMLAEEVEREEVEDEPELVEALVDEIPVRPPLFTPVEPPARVLELFKTKLTVDNKVKRVFFARGGDGWAGVGMASVETFLDYSVNAGFISQELADEVRGLHGEMIPWIYGQDVPDEFFERIQIIASDIMKRLDEAEAAAKVAERPQLTMTRREPRNAEDYLANARYLVEKKILDRTTYMSFARGEPGDYGPPLKALSDAGYIAPELAQEILSVLTIARNAAASDKFDRQQLDGIEKLLYYYFNKLVTARRPE